MLVIASDVERLDALATEVAAHGYYTFAAVPDAVADVVAVAKFDLVVVLNGAAPAVRDQLAQNQPPIVTPLLIVAASEEPELALRIRARLAPS